MMKNSRIALMLAITLFTVIATAQETISASKRSSAHRERAAGSDSIQEQIRLLRDDLQHQIDDLKSQLSAKDAQIRDLQAQVRTNEESQTNVVAHLQNVSSVVRTNTAPVNSAEGSLEQTQMQNDSLSASVPTIQKTEDQLKKESEQPVAIHYKGITIVPGGFLAGESVWRQRAMNADIYTNYNA